MALWFLPLPEAQAYLVLKAKNLTYQDQSVESIDNGDGEEAYRDT